MLDPKWQIVFKKLCSYLFVNLGELLKIVLKKGDFLFLCSAAPCVVRVHLSALHKTTQVFQRKTLKKHNL